MGETTAATQAAALRLPVGDQALIAWVWGQGPRTLVCLHGYAMQGRDFARLFPVAPAGWRIVAVDLAFFGESAWEGKVSAADLRMLGREIAEHFAVESLHLLGFSIGVRWALGLVARGTVPVKRAILVAPDGLKLHPVYRLATGTALGRGLFRAVLRRPGGLFLVARILHKLRLLSAGNRKLLERQLGTPAARTRVRQVWLGYADLRPNLRKVAQRSRDWDTEWHVIWGKRDRTTPPRLGRRFLREVPGTRRYLIEGGHFLLHPPSAELKDIVQSILQDE
ncbi:MAG: alpha/beta hydrolase [Bacteroidota bacterium]